jgi:lipoprotein-releasing system ATP-binding protein
VTRPNTQFDDSSGSLEPLPPPVAPPAVLRAVGLTKTYSTGQGKLELFRGLDLTIHQGEIVSIVGESGTGKSSLLHLLAALDTPTAGEVWCGEQQLGSFTPRQAASFRNRDIGYVWQFHYLLPEFTALENIAMPLLARGTKSGSAMEQALHWLGEVGLTERAQHRSGELSGGEQQRVSLARALVTQPRLLLADEPTGDLDANTAETIFALIQRLHAAHGLTSVIVTHNTDFAVRCDRMLRLRDGKLNEILR